MFDKALITRVDGSSVDGSSVDLGLLAETVFFYGSTHLLLNRASLVSLARQLPPDDLLAFLDRSELRLSFLTQGFGVVTAGPLRTSQFVCIQVAANQAAKKDFKADVHEVLERALGKDPATRKLAKEVCDRLVLHKFKGTNEGANTIPALAIEDAKDDEFMRAAAGVVLAHQLPSSAIPPKFQFRLEDTGRGFLVDTDLNFAKLNEIYRQRVPPSHSTLNGELILAKIISARSDSYFAAEYLAEIVTASESSEIIRHNHYDFLRRRDASSAALEIFKETALPDAPSIREAVNSSERTISDFLRLLDQAQKFKSWLGEGHPDSDLLARYVKAATAETWAEKLPTKTARWAFFTGVGAMVDAAGLGGLGTIASQGLSMADALLLDKLLKGWKPNHFIEGPYREFVRPG